jgi:hypothetical protein
MCAAATVMYIIFYFINFKKRNPDNNKFEIHCATHCYGKFLRWSFYLAFILTMVLIPIGSII